MQIVTFPGWRPLARYSLLLVVGLVLWTLTPGERQLGDGVKVVLVHVSLVWVGSIGMIVSGACALGGLAGSLRATGWAGRSGRLGGLFYAGGIGMSMIAAVINWGGIHWAEPRLRASFRFLAIAAIVHAGLGLLAANRPKVRAGVLLVLTAFFAWTLLAPQLQMHPGRAIKNAQAPAIKAAFGCWVALMGAFAISLAYDLSRRARALHAA